MRTIFYAILFIVYGVFPANSHASDYTIDNTNAFEFKWLKPIDANTLEFSRAHDSNYDIYKSKNINGVYYAVSKKNLFIDAIFITSRCSYYRTYADKLNTYQKVFFIAGNGKQIPGYYDPSSRFRALQIAKENPEIVISFDGASEANYKVNGGSLSKIIPRE